MTDDLKIKNIPVDKEKSKQIVEKLSDDVLKIIQKLGEKRVKLANQFTNGSFELGELQDKLDNLRKGIKDTNTQIHQKIEYAFKKMKLQRNKNYRWQFNGNDSFIGTEIPQTPKPNEKK